MDKTKTLVAAGALVLTLASVGVAIAANAGSHGNDGVGNFTPVVSTSAIEGPSPTASTSTIVVDVPVSDVAEPTTEPSANQLSADVEDNTAQPEVTTAPTAGASRRTSSPGSPRPATTTLNSVGGSDDGPSHEAGDDHASSGGTSAPTGGSDGGSGHEHDDD